VKPSAFRVSVIAAVHPLTGGAAQFNAAMVGALRDRVDVDVVSWRRMYPPLLYRGQDRDAVSRRPPALEAAFVLSWHDPRTWRRALRRVGEFDANALILPWLHPIMAPPYRWLLRKAPAGIRKIVICHNVLPHEPFRGSRALVRATLRHADLLVTHAPPQRLELKGLGLAGTPLLEAFHPRFVATDLADPPDRSAVEAERMKHGSPELLLLCFGAVRPYKGVDLALEALARVDPGLAVRLVIAGRFWTSRTPFERQISRLGLEHRVELRDGYLSNEETALLFTAADAAVLPYRSASQSGVAQLAFAYGKPVIATRVGGLPAAVQHGRNGLLSPPDDPAGLARAIERMARERDELARGVEGEQAEHSFGRYAELLEDGIRGLA
jgi:glycosyltransferase involved in cell wall biosynthesis